MKSKAILFILLAINLSCSRFVINTLRYSDNRTTQNSQTRMSYKKAYSLSKELNSYMTNYMFYPAKIKSVK